MTTAFTICANNYLAHARVLLDSFKKFHPKIPFYLILVDEKHAAIQYNELGAEAVLVAPELVAGFDELAEKYSIAELCTVIKPSLFQYIAEEYQSKDILYLDPDIEVFSEFREVIDLLNIHDVILTPHICSPTGDVGHPLDKDLMRTGIYNLGFIALSVNNETKKFLQWWDKRVREYGYHDLKEGYFYDQIWLGYAPAFLEKAYVLRHYGYNVANWNLHERMVILEDGVYYVNDTSVPLRFYHFSHFDMDKFPEIAAYNENFNLGNRKDIVPLYENYKHRLLNNQFERYKQISYKYGKQPESVTERNRLQMFARHIVLGLRALLK